MRHQTRTFMENLTHEHDFLNVLEVGSLDVNGNIADLFHGKYLGSDMREGKNVNDVVNGHNLVEKYGEGIFDCVCCFDTLEHDDAFWKTLEQMKLVLKTGGYLVLGFPSRNCPEHDHPHDYWRFMPQSMKHMLEGFENVYVEVQFGDSNKECEDEIYGYGRKV